MKLLAFSLIALTTLSASALAETGPTTEPVFQIEYTNPGLTPGHWILTLRADGSGHFHSERGSAASMEAQTLSAPNVDREIHLSDAFKERVFQDARHYKLFNDDCESHMKVAFQGWKKLSYKGPEGEGACQFNYSKDKEIQALGESLVGVADTILAGARLEMLMQHDRLGLDQEMEFLTQALGDGRAQQVCAIKGILERLAENPEVMERVRRRARTLLAHTEQ